MANELIRPADLPRRSSPVASELIPSDNGDTVEGVTLEELVNAGRPIATKNQAEAGVINTRGMSPLTTKQAIDAQVPSLITTAVNNLNLGTAAQSNADEFATAAQGSLADSAVQPGDLASVATSGDYDDLSNRPTLGTVVADIAELEAVNTDEHAVAIVSEAGRFGTFVYEEDDLSAKVAGDPAQAIYVAPTGETGEFGAWVRRQLGPQALEIFGAIGDSLTDDLDAVNEAIEAINTGLINGVALRPFGRYALSADPDPITASVWSWIGDGTPVFLAQDANSTVTRFFTIGSTSVRAGVFEIGGFRVSNNRNPSNLNPDHAPIFLKHAGLAYVHDITTGMCAGVLELGEKDGSTTVIQSRIVNVTGDCRADLGGKGIRINRASNTSFTSCSASLPAGVSASEDFRALLIKPNGEPIDSLKFFQGENNYPADRPVPIIFEIDVTGGNVVNCRFSEVVFDYARDRSLWIHCDGGGSGSFLNNHFDRTRFFCAGRSDGPDTMASVWIDNTGNTDFRRNTFEECYLYGRYGRAFRYNGTSNSDNNSLAMKDCRILDRLRTHSKEAAIEIGVRGFTLDGLQMEALEGGQSTGYTHAVKFLSNISRYSITNNDFTQVAGNDAISPENLVAGVVGEKLVSNNRGPVGPTFRRTAVTGTNILAQYVMLTQTAVMLEARITANRGNGAARAAFVIQGVFHKNTGSVIQLGTTNVVLSEPGTDAVTAVFSIDGDVIRVLVGNASVPYNWGCDVNVTQIPWSA